MKQVRTRIAPSPTGYPHIGTIYQALFNYAYAKKNGGKFIVRIEDTDQTRFVEGSEDVIFTSLDWVGLMEDESPRKGGDFGPYRQSERLSLYHEYAQKLLDLGFAYFSYYKKEDAGVKKDYSQKLESEKEQDIVLPDPPKTITEMISGQDWILRMKVPKNEQIIFHDEIRGDIIFDANQVTDQVLIKSDGFPTYHFAVVIDDHLMKISQILRAEEWISSTPKHILLYKYFGWDIPPIFHTATLRNPDKSKLSKRHGHTNVVWFQEEGYLPEAVLNFLALLGWTHPDEKEIFSLEEFISLFDFRDIRPVAPIFDLKKLDWMNGIYIREQLTNQELHEGLMTYD
ncbi:MAG: glutamate--tRNA ligase, partial [Candidatus Levybacteria bacterium]|nr:glutamate--tRNA ligase [Candidatus Levybacteria bacterium]